MAHITQEQFCKRFVALVQQSRGLPKKAQDRQILWISATLALDPERSYSEAELNDILARWCSRFGTHVELDHVTLRRYMADAGYLQRDSAGNAYRLTAIVPGWSHDSEIRALDLDVLVLAAAQERAARKEYYMGKAQS